MGLQSLLFILQLLLCLATTTLQTPVQGHITKPHLEGKVAMRVGEGSIDQEVLYAVIPSKTATIPPATTSGPVLLPQNYRRQHTSTTTTTWPFTLRNKRAPEATSIASKRAVTAKQDIKCNIAGYASRIYAQHVWSSTSASDVLACQTMCMATSQCQSYGFTTVASASGNCVFYAATFDPRNNYVLKNTYSPWRFSDKYPSDGTNFCYSGNAI